MNRDEIIQKYPIAEYIQQQGKDLKGNAVERMCRCFFHSPDKNPSMCVNVEKHTYKCFSCGAGGSVIDLYAHINGLTIPEALKQMGGEPVEKAKPKTVKTTTYDYTDAYGRNLYYVDRLDLDNGKKTFRQYRKENGKRINGLDNIERVLYRLNKIADKQQVIITEGEKCVHALCRMGFDATTNCGGSGGWLDGYVDSLRDKDVVIMPDNDEPGKKWHKAVLDSIAGKVKSVQTINVPPEYNDIGDIYAEHGDKATEMLFGWMTDNAVIERGIDLPIYSAKEVMQKYTESITTHHPISVNLGRWLPSLQQRVRPLVPGELITVMADTGVGKSAIMQNIAISQPHLKVLFFELELPVTHMGERFTAITNNKAAKDVERETRTGGSFATKAWDHIYTCDTAGLTVEQIAEMIHKAELKMGSKPDVVMIDYIGLIQGGQGKRYERMSTIAESLKVLAKASNVILFISSQVHRKEHDEPTLHDAKDSGSIENSSSLVLGAWRPSKPEMNIKILKNTKGYANDVVECNFDGAKMLITERFEEISAT